MTIISPASEPWHPAAERTQLDILDEMLGDNPDTTPPAPFEPAPWNGPRHALPGPASILPTRNRRTS